MTSRPLSSGGDQYLSEALAAQRAGNLEAAAGLYERVLAQNPEDLQAQINRGDVLAKLGRGEEARASYGQALALRPTLHKTRADLACLHEECGDIELALQEWEQLASQARAQGALSQTVLALNQMARILMTVVRDYPRGEAVARQILAIDPSHPDAVLDFINARQRQYAWPVVAPFGPVTRERLLAGITPLAACVYTDDPLFQRAINARRNPPAQPGITLPPIVPAERLRIGYLSSDLRVHAVGVLMYEVPGLHDRSRVEVFLYYTGPKTDDNLHQHYKTQGDHFIDISELGDEAAARRIADDGIHILVDLNGHTMHHRLDVLARRPAPVIVNWLGFPGTMGGPHHHYIIADDWVIPPEYERYYSERVMRLACFMPNNRQREVSDVVPTRASAGLPEDAFVLCCFNDARKITRRTFERWLTVLQRVPNAVLWLHRSIPSARERMRTHAGSMGIHPARLIFADVKPTIAEHLARYPLADLFLDTAPYGAHATGSEALWMGVPVITFSGRSFASRVCGSLLRQAGLGELVCTRAQDFVELAVALATDPVRVASYKERLEAARYTSALSYTPDLVRGLEDLYEAMWEEALAGRLPKPDMGDLDAYLKVGASHDHDAVEVQTIEDYEGFWRDRLSQLNLETEARRGPEGQ